MADPQADPVGRWRARRLRPLHRAARQAGRAGASHLRRRIRDRRRRGRARRGGGFPEKSAALHKARCARSARRAAVRAPGDREDAAGTGGRGGGGRRLLLLVGLGVHRGDRGRGRLTRARPLQAGQGGGTGDRLHRRAGRDRPLALGQRRRDQRRPRRARANAQPDPDRDGRVRGRHQRDRPGRHEPPRDPGPCAAATGAVRPPHRGSSARPERSRRDPEDPYPLRAARSRRRPRTNRGLDAGSDRRRHRAARERGGAVRGPPRTLGRGAGGTSPTPSRRSSSAPSARW